MPAPSGLVAELVVPKPAELWASLRGIASGTAPLPASAELVITALFELPVLTASALDLSRPVTGALLSVELQPDPVPVLAFRVLDGNEVLGRVASGPSASFEAKASSVTGLALLAPKTEKEGAKVRFGVYRNHLLVSPEAAAIESAAPYLVRTLATRPLPDAPLVVELPGQALAGPLVARARRSWEQYQSELRALERRAREEKGRAADFADPQAVITALDGALSALFEIFASTERARLTLLPSADALNARLELVPAPGRYAERTIDALSVGELGPLLSLPDSVALAFLWRASSEERRAAVAQAGLGVERLFGERLKERDRGVLERTLGGFHAGRGEEALCGLLRDRTFFFQTKPADAKALRAAVIELERALEVPAVKAPLREYAGDYSVRRSSVALDGASVERFVFEPKGQAGRGKARYEALYAERGQSSVLVLGQNPSLGLKTLLQAGEGDPPRLAKLAPHHALLSGLPRDVHWALFADASLLGLVGPQAPSAPLFVTLGREGRSARVDIALSAAAARAVFARIRGD